MSQLHIGPNFRDAKRAIALYERLLRAVDIQNESWWIRWMLKRTALKAVHGMFATNNTAITGCSFSGLGRGGTGIALKSKPTA